MNSATLLAHSRFLEQSRSSGISPKKRKPPLPHCDEKQLFGGVETSHNSNNDSNTSNSSGGMQSGRFFLAARDLFGNHHSLAATAAALFGFDNLIDRFDN